MVALNFPLVHVLAKSVGHLALPRALARSAAASGTRSSTGGSKRKARARQGLPRASHAKPETHRQALADKIADWRGGWGAGILAAPLQILTRFAFSSMTVQRKGASINVQFSHWAPDAPAAAPVDRALTDALPMRKALKTLLDAHPKTRAVMRHLAFFEGALAIHGTKATGQVPIDVLSTAVGQFETLVMNWSNFELADLRSRMAVAVMNRSRDPFHGTSQDRLSNFFTESRLSVHEASHSMFQELERQSQHSLRASPLKVGSELVVDATVVPRVLAP